MLSIGAIGYRNHAARIIDLVEGSSRARISHVFHPTRWQEAPNGVDSIEALMECDAVMILSPSDTHYHYLNYFSGCGYQGYLFCEKPPVVTTAELEALRIDPARTYFNFNQRCGRVRSFVQEAMAEGLLGTPVSASIVVGHGLAFKPAYKGSWRSDIRRHRHGVAETLAIHYVDLLEQILGPAADLGYHSWNVARTGTADDSCRFSLRFGTGAVGEVVASYAMPLCHSVRVVGTDGIVEYERGRLSLRHPRDTFDERGYFASAPVLLSENWSEEQLYQDSLRRSVDYFLDVCEGHKAFPAPLCFSSLELCRRILALPSEG